MMTIRDFLKPVPLLERAARPFPLLVLIGPFAAGGAMLSLAAQLAVYAPLHVLDGGNRFNAREVARFLRQRNAPSISDTLERIRVARAFTCYQMLALLEDKFPWPHPTLVVDLLDTFYDESASLAERRRLLKNCIACLEERKQWAPVAVSVRPPKPGQTDPTGLLEIVKQAADTLWFQNPELEQSSQPQQLSLL
jgi:hypothetical protein